MVKTSIFDKINNVSIVDAFKNCFSKKKQWSPVGLDDPEVYASLSHDSHVRWSSPDKIRVCQARATNFQSINNYCLKMWSEVIVARCVNNWVDRTKFVLCSGIPNVLSFLNTELRNTRYKLTSW